MLYAGMIPTIALIIHSGKSSRMGVSRVQAGGRDPLCLCTFFFSSRRRHTRLQGDWSSDVCSSDLCAISGGPYIDHGEDHNGADAVVPVDLYVPGCPPHPFTILDGLLRLLGRIDERSEIGRASCRERV